MAGSTRRGAEDVLVRDRDTGEVLEIDRPSLKDDPDQYHVLHSNFVEPSAEDIAGARARLEAAPLQWTPPNLVHEIPEFERAAEDLGGGIEAVDLLEAAGRGQIVPLTHEMWSSMENTDSWATDTVEEAIEHARLYDKDIRDVFQGIGKGPMEVPMVLCFTDGSTRLVGGNTRLMVFRALGVTPKVLLVRVPGRKGEGLKMAHDVAAAFKQVVLARNVAHRFAAKEKAVVGEAEVLEGRALPKIRSRAEALTNLANRAEDIASAADLDGLGDGAEKRLLALREKGLLLTHQLAENFDNLVPVVHSLEREKATRFKPVVDLFLDLNKTWWGINRKNPDPLKVPAELHALAMSCSSLMTQYAITIRGLGVEGLGKIAMDDSWRA